VNKPQKQVEAHNAQQREKVDAKRERERVSKVDVNGKGDRRGKRVIRRVDNGTSHLIVELMSSGIQLEPTYRSTLQIGLVSFLPTQSTSFITDEDPPSI
jgi:hypothetical protein